ncbi:MAG: PDZ domain-containing protein [Nostoc sp.]|uniref:PDZ domain-containing protein n=1 Tax=Nostoc sp. TaxID=1180 RepID=UPI002FFABAB4
MVNFIGRVVNQSNEPIDGARVSLNFEGNIYVAYTDSEGKYRFSIYLLSRGSFNGDIKVEANNYKIYSRLIEISSSNPQIEEFRLIAINDSTSSVQIKVAQISRQTLILVAIIGLLGTLITLLVQHYSSKKPDDKNKSSIQSQVDTSINFPNTKLSSTPTTKPNIDTISPSPSATFTLKPNINRNCIGVIHIFYKKIYTQHFQSKLFGDLDLPVDGVVIKEVFEGSPAAKQNLQVGDMVIAVDDKPIISSSDFKNKIKNSVLWVNLKVIRPSFYSFNISSNNLSYSGKPPYKEYKLFILPEDCQKLQ